MGPFLPQGRISTICVIWVFRNDREYKWFFLFPKINPAPWKLRWCVPVADPPWAAGVTAAEAGPGKLWPAAEGHHDGRHRNHEPATDHLRWRHHALYVGQPQQEPQVRSPARNFRNVVAVMSVWNDRQCANYSLCLQFWRFKKSVYF